MKSILGPLLLAMGLVSAAAGLATLQNGNSWGAYLYVVATILFLGGVYIQIRYLQFLALRKQELKAAERQEKMRQLREMIVQIKANDERRGKNP